MIKFVADNGVDSDVWVSKGDAVRIISLTQHAPIILKNNYEAVLLGELLQIKEPRGRSYVANHEKVCNELREKLGEE